MNTLVNYYNMKKGICTLLLMFMTSAVLFGQLRHEQQSQLGLRAGVNFATIDDGLDQLEEIEEEPRLARLTIGLATSFWMSQVMAFAPEVNFSQRGYKATGNDLLGQEYTHTYNYNYIEIPLLLRATFGQQLVRGYINAGPTLGYLLSGKEKITDSSGSREEKIDTEDEIYNVLEVGAAAGGGIHFNTGIGSFMIDLRYHTAFTDLQKEEFRLPAYVIAGQAPEKFRNQYVSISLMYLGPYRE